MLTVEEKSKLSGCQVGRWRWWRPWRNFRPGANSPPGAVVVKFNLPPLFPFISTMTPAPDSLSHPIPYPYQSFAIRCIWSNIQGIAMLPNFWTNMATFLSPWFLHNSFGLWWLVCGRLEVGIFLKRRGVLTKFGEGGIVAQIEWRGCSTTFFPSALRWI